MEELQPTACKTAQFYTPPNVHNQEFAVNDCNSPNALPLTQTPTADVIAYDKDARPSILSVFVNDAKNTEGYTFQGHMDFIMPNKWVTRLFYFIFNKFDVNARYYSFYLPDKTHEADIIKWLSDNPAHILNDFDRQAKLEFSQQGQIGSIATSELPFSGTIYVYTDTQLSLERVGDIAQSFRSKGANIQFRGPDYVTAIWDNTRLGLMPPIGIYQLHGSPPEIEPVRQGKN